MLEQQLQRGRVWVHACGCVHALAGTDEEP